MQGRKFIFCGLPWRVWLLLGLTIGLVEGRPVWAQEGVRMHQRAISPSLSSPVNRMDRNFGRVGTVGVETHGFQYDRNPGNVSSVNRNRGLGRAGRRQPRMRNARSPMGRGMLNRTRPNVGRNRLLGQNRGYNDLSQNTGLAISTYGSRLLSDLEKATFAGRSRYENVYQYPGRIGIVSTKYAYRGAPELVAKRSNSTSEISLSQEKEDLSIPAPKVSLQERVKKDLSSRRKVYKIRAMEAFKAGHYHRACSQLELAIATIVDEYDEKMYFKLVYMYASIAGEQYAEALSTLYWVLSEDPITGGLRNPQVLNRVSDVGSFYGHQDEYVSQSRKLIAFLETQPRESQIVGLRAILAWGAGDRVEATFHARQILDIEESDIEKSKRWSRLYEMMQQAQQVSQAEQSEQAHEPVSSESSLLGVGQSAAQAGEESP